MFYATERKATEVLLEIENFSPVIWENAVGAGDSMVAGFIAGWLNGQNYEHAFCMGLAAGSASAFSENLATSEEVAKVYRDSFVNSK